MGAWVAGDRPGRRRLESVGLTRRHEGAKARRKTSHRSFVRARRPVPCAIHPARFALSNRLAISGCSSREKSTGYPGWNRNWNWALHRLAPWRLCVSQERIGKMSQRSREGEALRPSGIFPHRDGTSGRAIELPFVGYRMDCFVTLESGCRWFVATCVSRGDLHTQVPTAWSAETKKGQPELAVPFGVFSAAMERLCDQSSDGGWYDWPSSSVGAVAPGGAEFSNG